MHQKEQALIHARELSTILDNQSGWVYIIDRQTHRLEYCNCRTAKRLLDKTPGTRCYQALMGRQAPCPGCPAEQLREDGCVSAILQDEKYPYRILAEATDIQWQGRERCLMSCRKLPE